MSSSRVTGVDFKGMLQCGTCWERTQSCACTSLGCKATERGEESDVTEQVAAVPAVTQDMAQAINSPWKPPEDNEAMSNGLHGIAGTNLISLT